jgi:hypothetical protein
VEPTGRSVAELQQVQGVQKADSGALAKLQQVQGQQAKEALVAALSSGSTAAAAAVVAETKSNAKQQQLQQNKPLDDLAVATKKLEKADVQMLASMQEDKPLNDLLVAKKEQEKGNVQTLASIQGDDAPKEKAQKQQLQQDKPLDNINVSMFDDDVPKVKVPRSYARMHKGGNDQSFDWFGKAAQTEDKASAIAQKSPSTAQEATTANLSGGEKKQLIAELLSQQATPSGLAATDRMGRLAAEAHPQEALLPESDQDPTKALLPEASSEAAKHIAVTGDDALASADGSADMSEEAMQANVLAALGDKLFGGKTKEKQKELFKSMGGKVYNPTV